MVCHLRHAELYQKMRIPKYIPSSLTTKDLLNELIQGIKNGNPLLFPKDKIPEEDYNELKQYVSKLYQELQKSALQTKEFSRFDSQYYLFKESYDVHTRWGVYEQYVDFLISQKQYESALKEWTLLQEEEYSGRHQRFSYRDQAIDRLILFEHLLQKSIMSGYYIEKIAPKGNQLTAFGRRNADNVLGVIDTMILTSGESFFKPFYPNYSFDIAEQTDAHDYEYYKQFFESTTQGVKAWKWLESPEGMKYGGAKRKNGKATQGLIKLAIQNHSSGLLREGENEYRKSIGARKVGEAWISETELYYKLKHALSHLNVIHHGKPEWLGRQHFDIWIPELNCAIEYQGQQHDKPVDFFGGEKAFKANQKRDLEKKKKANQNKVRLIEVRPGYNLEDVIDNILTKSNSAKEQH